MLCWCASRGGRAWWCGRQWLDGTGEFPLHLTFLLPLTRSDLSCTNECGSDEQILDAHREAGRHGRAGDLFIDQRTSNAPSPHCCDRNDAVEDLVSRIRCWCAKTAHVIIVLIEWRTARAGGGFINGPLHFSSAVTGGRGISLSINAPLTFFTPLL